MDSRLQEAFAQELKRKKQLQMISRLRNRNDARERELGVTHELIAYGTLLLVRNSYAFVRLPAEIQEAVNKALRARDRSGTPEPQRGEEYSG